jgi:histidine triad (HIT) family protein
VKEENCVFCKIIQDKIPSEKVYEDSNYLCFLDIRPVSPGHTLVIPKRHVRWVWDCDNAGEYFEVAKKIAIAQRKAFNTDFILSKIVGDEVPHAHIWVFPNDKVSGEKHDFKTNAEKIRKALSSV